MSMSTINKEKVKQTTCSQESIKEYGISQSKKMSHDAKYESAEFFQQMMD